jgi:hypothetical protein
MNQLNEKEKQILEDHEKASEVLRILKDKENTFVSKIENIKQEMTKLQSQIAVVNSEILTLNEKIESSKNESSTGTKDKKISFEELKINCANIINTFIREIPHNNINKANLRFKIKYGKMNLERLIEDENIDFHRLKLETKVQFDKNENDFFFTDENGNIYLDNLNIRRALFPLESIVIENYVPTIYVIDRKTNLPDIKEGHKQLQINSNATEDNKTKPNLINRIIRSIVVRIWKFFNLIAFLVFMICWINSCIFFRNVDEYNNLVKPFLENRFVFQGSTVLFNNIA